MIFLITDLLRAALVSLPLYLLLRFLFLRGRSEPPRRGREALLLLFVCFSAGAAVLAFTPGHALNGSLPVFAAVSERLQTLKAMNFVPFFTIRSYFAGGWGSAFLINVVANIFLFCPFGFFPPLLWRRWQSPKRLVLLALLLPLAIEFTQLWLGRSVDVDDWLLNTLGILLGVGFYWLLRRIFPSCASLAAESAQKGTDGAPS